MGSCSISILDQLAQLLEYLLGDDVSELLHLFHDLGHFAQVVDPLVVGQLLPGPPVPVGQMERGDVLVKAVHVPAVEEDFLLHPSVEQGFEHREHHVEHPGLVEDVYRVSLHRERRHHQRYHHIGNLSTRGNVSSFLFFLD